MSTSIYFQIMYQCSLWFFSLFTQALNYFDVIQTFKIYTQVASNNFACKIDKGPKILYKKEKLFYILP